MQWTRLSEIPKEAFFSKALAQQADGFNERIAKILAGRVRIDQARDELAQQNATSALAAGTLGDQLAAADNTRLGFVHLLGEELRLRRELVAFDDARHAERCAAADRAFSDFEAVKAEIRQKLEAIGYLPGPPEGNSGPCTIQPGMILRNPRVYAARTHAEALFDQTTSRIARNENLAAIQAIETEAARIKQKAAAA